METENIKEKDFSKDLYGSYAVSEKYSENYSAASATTTRKKLTVNTKLVAYLTTSITVFLALVINTLSGINIKLENLNLYSTSIEYEFSLNYDEDDQLEIHLYNDEESFYQSINSDVAKGTFLDLQTETTYTLEVVNKNNDSIIYTTEIVTLKE